MRHYVSEKKKIGITASGIKTCDHKLPDYAACLKSALQESWAIMAKGIYKVYLSIIQIKFGLNDQKNFISLL